MSDGTTADADGGLEGAPADGAASAHAADAATTAKSASTKLPIRRDRLNTVAMWTGNPS